MSYLLVLLEGIITFVSPCLLPLLPVYLSYFATDAAGERHKRGQTLAHALLFVVGFTIVFTTLGALSGVLGAWLERYRTAFDLVSGGIVVLLGIGYMGLLPIHMPHVAIKGYDPSRMGMVKALLFGMVFAVSQFPCIGTHLGAALMLAAHSGGVLGGITMLLTYCLGLAIPFVISALLVERLGNAFAWIKSHMKQINIACGVILVLLGFLMMTGWFFEIVEILEGHAHP